MKSDWIKMMPHLLDNLQNATKIECPNCHKYGINYIYIGDEETRVGYLQVWCNECLKGIYISRAIAPSNARFAAFDDDIKGVIPQYEFVED